MELNSQALLSLWQEVFTPQRFFMPHGHCYLWQTNLVSLHVLSDTLTALAYFSIPATLAYFIHKRRLAAVNRALEGQVAERKKAEATLQELSEELEQRVQQHTEELLQANTRLQREITEHRHAEAALRSSEAQFRTTFEQAAVGIVQLDLEGRFSRVNQQFCNILGYAEEAELLGRRWSIISYPEDVEVEQHFFYHLRDKTFQIFSRQKRCVCKDGSIRWGNITFSLAYKASGEADCYVGVHSDISQRRQAEKKICQALTKEKELNELKSRFISMTSHELRTPLAVISSSAGILKNFRHKLSEEKKEKHLDCIQRYVKHTAQLLDDILLLNKAEVGKLEFEPSSFNLVEFCQELVQELQLNAIEHHLVFVRDRQCSITKNYIYSSIDKKLLRQILINLISNAIKYSPAKSNVQIRMMVQNRSVTFEVQDEGIGIPEEAQSKLFEEFYRAPNSEETSGTGLGLSIVKKCTDLHGGKISFMSQIGVGTTFTIILPLH